MSKDTLIEKVDDLLPQTQCGLCGYAGCMPYAKAMVLNNEAINRCPPGGVRTLNALGELLQRDAQPFMQEMTIKAKFPTVALIREADCIGCTKCIQACPVDAIIGSAKRMHTVIAQECTGCELCVAPCPVDCIDLIPLITAEDEFSQKEKSASARKRYHSRQKRLQTKIEKKTTHSSPAATDSKIVMTRKMAIQEAVARVQAKKGSDHEC